MLLELVLLELELVELVLLELVLLDFVLMTEFFLTWYFRYNSRMNKLIAAVHPNPWILLCTIVGELMK